MHVVQVMYKYPKFQPTLESYLREIHTLPLTAEAIAQRGIKITVAMRFWHNNSQTINGVHYVLFKDALPNELKRLHVPKQFHAIIKAQHADVVWVHNLRQVFRIKELCKCLDKSSVVVQNHGETPLKNWSWLMRYQLKQIKGVVFTLKSQAKAWYNLNIIPPSIPCFEVVEGASPYQLTQNTGRNNMYSGHPVFLWTGNLNRNKDPFTILQAFEKLAQTFPAARLYMAFRHTEMEKEVQNTIMQSDILSESVTLLGELSRSDMQSFYNAGHYFLQGSAREASGFSLIEALACGTVPIVTNIPSFNQILGNGAVGHVFSIGDSESLYQSMRNALAIDWQIQSSACIKHYKTHLSFSKIAKNLHSAFNVLSCSKRIY